MTSAFGGRTAANLSDGRRGDARRATHARPAGDQGGRLVSQQASNGLDSRTEKPAGIAWSVDERESAIGQLAAQRCRGLIQCHVDDGADARRVDAAKVADIAGMAQPE